MMKSMPSSKSTKKQSSATSKILNSKTLPKKFAPLLSLLILLGNLSSCAPTYPAKTLTTQLTKLIKEEQNINVTCHLSGKTLWVYLPLQNLIDEEKVVWNTEGIETMSKAISVIHRVILSTDAKLNFLAIVAADVKKYGIEMVNIEYVPDISQAVLEKFSRGEFFLRSVRDIGVNPASINDLTGKSKKFYDISFDEFLAMQIIHRTKSLFVKNKALAEIFEIKSSSHSEKFGIIKIDIEFLKKKYNLPPRENKINPLDYAKMIAALIVKTYDYKNFQIIELTDTFSSQTTKLAYKDLKDIKINLPEMSE